MWCFCWRYRFQQIRNGEFGRFSVVYVDCALQSIIFINYLVFIRHTADSIGFFPSRRQLGSTLGQGGEGKD